MNKLTKIGISALAGSLVAVSAHAGSMSVSGSASITLADSDVDNTQATTAEGNLWTMGDSLTFSGGGELDNGMTVSVKYEYDDDEADANEGGTNGGFDSHSITLSSDEMGSITFAGHGGDGAMSALDDKTPNAYEESWDAVKNADTQNVGGTSGDNMFTYKSPSISGAVVTIGYLPGGSKDSKTTTGGYADFGITVKPEAVEGLEVGFAMGESEETAGSKVDEQAMYVKYTYGSITAGYQMNEADGPTSSTDVETTAFGISYALTDDITVAYNQASSDRANSTRDQDSTGISASFTSGGITVAGVMNSVDNVAYATTDAEGYEFNISFAF
jgi:outer membrane protein OmpU